MTRDVLLTLSLLLGAALAARFIASLLRIPEILVLVAFGALFGPSVLDVVDVPLDSIGAQLLNSTRFVSGSWFLSGSWFPSRTPSSDSTDRRSTPRTISLNFTNRPGRARESGHGVVAHASRSGASTRRASVRRSGSTPSAKSGS